MFYGGCLGVAMGVFDFLRVDADQDRFASRVMQRLRQRGWPHPMRYDRTRFEIGLGGDAGQIHLENIFSDWLKFPKSERAEQLDKAIAFVFEMGADQSWEAVRDNLLPIVRPRVFFENTGLTASHDWTMGPTFLQKPLAGPLSILLAVDRKHSFATVNTELFDEWGRPFDDVLAIALDNLRARSPCRFERQEGGFYLSNFGDWSDVSRILLPDLFEQLGLKGDPVAISIVREGLVVAGSQDAEALKAMAAFAEDAFLTPRAPYPARPWCSGLAAGSHSGRRMPPWSH